MSQALRVWSMPLCSLDSPFVMSRISWYREPEHTFPSLMLPDARRISPNERIWQVSFLSPMERKDEQ